MFCSVSDCGGSRLYAQEALIKDQSAVLAKVYFAGFKYGAGNEIRTRDLLVGPEILRDSTTELFLKFIVIRTYKPFFILAAFFSFDSILKLDGFGFGLE